jgi:hypothetical protein
MLAGAAAAQETALLPGVSAEDRERFRTCRAAVFYQLDRGSTPGAVLSRATAEALNEQIAFVMAETLRNAPGGSLDANRRMLDFTESFFLNFSRTVAERRDLATDAAARERILLDCQPLIWSIVREQVDRLLALRDGGTPGLRSPTR